MNPPINERLKNLASANGRRTNKEETAFARAKALLDHRRLPLRVGVADAAILLNVGEHDIPVLVRAGVLQPLGDPQPNAVKYFMTVDLLERADDREWLSEMCDAIYEYWSKKNAKAKTIPRTGKNGTRGTGRRRANG